MLSRLLEDFREPLEKLVSVAILQELDLLFNFRGGPSVRHEMAHGKMSDSDFWNLTLPIQYGSFSELRSWPRSGSGKG